MTWKLLPLVVVTFMGLASEAQAQDPPGCRECRSQRTLCEETGTYFQRYYCADALPGFASCSPVNNFGSEGCSGSCTESGDCEYEPFAFIAVTSNGAPLPAWRSGVHDLTQRGACRRVSAQISSHQDGRDLSISPDL
jgi:hypothetical protein